MCAGIDVAVEVDDAPGPPAMNEHSTSRIEALRDWDERRPSLPGEHWLTATIGIFLLLRPGKSVLGRVAYAGAGALLLIRALSGRDGPLAALERRREQEFAETDFIEVAAPWPYSQRVRITPPRRVRGSAETAQRVNERASP